MSELPMKYDVTVIYDDGVFKWIGDEWVEIAPGNGPKCVVPEALAVLIPPGLPRYNPRDFKPGEWKFFR